MYSSANTHLMGFTPNSLRGGAGAAPSGVATGAEAAWSWAASEAGGCMRRPYPRPPGLSIRQKLSVEQQHRRRLIDMADVGLAVGVEADRGQPVEHVPVFDALIQADQLAGAFHAVEVQDRLDAAQSLDGRGQIFTSTLDDVAGLQDANVR